MFAPSNGKVVTPIDWRANQLADVLAKHGALSSLDRRRAATTIEVAGQALLHHAALLGQVTHLANNCPKAVVMDGGQTKQVFERDSTSAPKYKKTAARTNSRTPTPQPRQASPAAPSPPDLRPVSASGLRAAAARRRAKQRATDDKCIVDRLVTETAARSSRNAGPSAGHRLEALRMRVRAKSRPAEKASGSEETTPAAV